MCHLPGPQAWGWKPATSLSRRALAGGGVLGRVPLSMGAVWVAIEQRGQGLWGAGNQQVKMRVQGRPAGRRQDCRSHRSLCSLSVPGGRDGARELPFPGRVLHDPALLLGPAFGRGLQQSVVPDLPLRSSGTGRAGRLPLSRPPTSNRVVVEPCRRVGGAPCLPVGATSFPIPRQPVLRAYKARWPHTRT